MSRVSTVVLGTVACAIVATVAGCQASLTVKTKNRFVEPDVVQEDSADWTGANGQTINIQIEGVGVSVNGGVSVTSDPSITKVKATARMLAMAFTEEKSNADQSIVEAKQTFTISHTDSAITVSCGHGQTHGSSNGGDSGCEFIDVRVPAGNANAPLRLSKVLSGNGTVTLQLSNATLAELGVNSNGGNITSDLPATEGGNYSLVSEKADDITVKLPADFSADNIILQADADKIDLGPFSDIQNGDGKGGRGTKGQGLASLKVTSKDFAGETGHIALTK